MRRFILLAVAAAAVALPSVAVQAGHCNGTVTDVGGVYTDARPNEPVPYTYVESNGIPGLQSGGANLFGYVDTCSHANPDTFLY